jgi:hypothetical protein
MRSLLRGSLAALLFTAPLSPLAAQVDVLTHRYDGARSGANLRETVLNKSNVNNNRFGKLAFRIVDGNPYAQPLIVSRAAIANRPNPLNVVIVATEHNSVYAFDADDTSPAVTALESSIKALWHTGPDALGQPVGIYDLYDHYPVGQKPNCGDLTTEVGITSTPVVRLSPATSPKGGAIFVVAKSQNGGQISQRLFALNLADGKPLGGGTLIAADIPAPNGTLHFDPVAQLNRPALLLDQDVLYIAFGGHCDAGDYRGWVFAYDVSNPAAPQKLDVFSSTFAPRQPNDDDKEGRAGIWMSGQGLATDGAGGVYFATGDGTYNTTNPNFLQLGDAVVKVKVVSGKIRVQDWYAPQNRDDLKRFDVDLGSGGTVPVPNSHLLLAGGKEGRLYLIDRNDMGRGVKQALHSFQVTNPPLRRVNNPTRAGDILYWNLHGSPVVWPRAGDMFVYVMGEEDRLKQYRLLPRAGAAGWGFASDVPLHASMETVGIPNPPNGLPNDVTRNTTWMPGGFLTLSANGTNAATGILWATMPFSANANQEVVRGALRAFDATDVSRGQLWSSEDTGVAADRLGFFAKFNPPVVANGKVYVATFQQERLDNNRHARVDTGDQPALAIYGLK